MKNETSKTEQPCTIQNVRLSALEWWHLISFENQFLSTIEWLSHNNRATTERHPHHLTGREIQEIYELLHSA
jgi:hypothetical protein